MGTKIWQKSYELNELVEDFTVGEDYILDQRLVFYDCIASIAHAKMLGKIGIINESETDMLVDELNRIIELDKKGKFKINKQDEDCHTAIENHLIVKCGDTGKKIHTFRSRNDQVLTALRLYYKDEIKTINKNMGDLITGIQGFIEKYGSIEIPGYTHTRKAMPSSVALWAGAVVDSMLDNKKILASAADLIDQSPLGSGAGYGVDHIVDREYTAEFLKFKGVQKNPVYVQNSRGKFEACILNALSCITFDMNKAASDLILFTMPDFGYFHIPDEFMTGSSIMPQKKNPDVLELLRANHHVIISLEFRIKNTTANLISGYHRDFQITKGPVMKGFDIVKDCLTVFLLLFENLKINEENCKRGMTRELYAAQKAYELVKQGIPFREAYKIVAKEFSNN